MRTIFIFTFALLVHFSFSQEKDSVLMNSVIPKPDTFINGALSITNNGISTVPYLSLGKPAFITDLSLSRGHFSFDPQLKFNIPDARPWSFIFWFRYRFADNEKFKFRVGAHPAYSFRARTATINGIEQETITVWRFLAGEIAPLYYITPNLSVGPYYLYAYNMEKNAIKHSHFISLQTNITNIRLSDEFYLGVFPQFYYLTVGTQKGFYAYASVSLAKKDFPFSLSAVANKEIKSDIAGSESFLWNVTLMYSFGKRSVSKRDQ